MILGGIIIEKTIYGDILMVINFSMDFLALYVTAGIMHLKPKSSRLTLASAMGAFYSLLVLLFGINGLFGAFLSVSVSCLMTYTAYPRQRPSDYLKNTAVFYLTSFALGGGITAICNLLNVWQNSRGIEINGTFDVIYGDVPFGIFVILAVICALLSRFGGRLAKEKRAKKECVLEITLGGHSVTLKALVDSGNLLKEPISEKPVIIASYDSARKLLPLDMLQVFRSVSFPDTELLRRYPKIRIIPTSSVGGSRLLLAFCPDRIIIDGKETDAYLAIDPTSSDFGGFKAIVPSVII